MKDFLKDYTDIIKKYNLLEQYLNDSELRTARDFLQAEADRINDEYIPLYIRQKRGIPYIFVEFLNTFEEVKKNEYAEAKKEKKRANALSCRKRKKI